MEVGQQVKSDDADFATTLAGRMKICGWAMVGVALAFLLLAPAARAEDAQEILAKARMSQAAQKGVLQGQLRHGATVIPFVLTLDEGEIKYAFSNPPETLSLQLGEKGTRLVEVTDKGGQRVVTDAQYDKAVRGTPISYEDLSMRFLYWPVAKVLGEDIRLTRNCWKVRIEPGSPKNSQYGAVIIWVEKQSGALVRVETYDKSGNLSKRFEAVSVQKVDGGYILKQMRIQAMEDGKPSDPTPTYLEIKKPEES